MASPTHSASEHCALLAGCGARAAEGARGAKGRNAIGQTTLGGAPWSQRMPEAGVCRIECLQGLCVEASCKKSSSRLAGYGPAVSICVLQPVLAV